MRRVSRSPVTSPSSRETIFPAPCAIEARFHLLICMTNPANPADWHGEHAHRVEALNLWSKLAA
jgi:hypothetical protein